MREWEFDTYGTPKFKDELDVNQYEEYYDKAEYLANKINKELKCFSVYIQPSDYEPNFTFVIEDDEKLMDLFEYISEGIIKKMGKDFDDSIEQNEMLSEEVNKLINEEWLTSEYKKINKYYLPMFKEIGYVKY